MRVSGLILAGGQGRRMQNRDKGWIELAGKPMIERVIERLSPQVDEVIINANRNISSYTTLQHRVIEDEIQGFQGPLAGILSGLKQCKNKFMVCVPCDTPFFPCDLVSQMTAKQHTTSADVISVSDGNRIHPVFALIKSDLAGSLEDYLAKGERKIDRWYQQHNFYLIEYPGGEHFFENINTVEQLEMAASRIESNG